MLTAAAVVKAIFIPLASAIVLAFFFRRSAPPRRVTAAFFIGGWGAFLLHSAILRSVPPVLPPDQFYAATLGQAFTSAFVEAAVPEEFAKGGWILLFLYIWRNEFSPHGAFAGALIGLGFSMRENLAYAATVEEWRGFAVMSHGAWGAVTGRLLQWALETPPGRFWKALWAFVPSILLHGLMDAMIFVVDVLEPPVTGVSAKTHPQEDVGLASLIPMLGACAAALFSWIWAIRCLRLARQRMQRIAGRSATPGGITRHRP
ncbi:PrsW family glutamic-type intramembrane protease [Alienimonas californiensis]|uniref:Protease PrsW n=1 Tax=Alienimonas californiensis TaxID=2527989 RepID=A0A517P948_9PLAN|nr:PrsW family glutamic-type intramembrane protease [Alienimonas californiensis]QDT15903.1 hypothetical protein CA12_20010 [Alienimonas californiensis]